MRPRPQHLVAASLALLAPTAAFCGGAAIVVATVPQVATWDQPVLAVTAPVVVPRVVITVVPSWGIHAPSLYRPWGAHAHTHVYGHGHGHGHGHAPIHRHAPGGGPAYHAGPGPGRWPGHQHGAHRAHGPDRHGWR
jgi:hypothetical protein